MFPNLKVDATKVYLFIEFAASTFFAMMFVTMSLYEATVAGLTPVQLVLVGTTVEVSAYFCLKCQQASSQMHTRAARPSSSGIS